MILPSISSIPLRSPWVALALACVFMQSSFACGQDKCGSLDRAVIAIRLVRTLYPEAKGRELSLQFSEGTGGRLSGPTDVRNFLIAMDKPQWQPPGKSSGQPDVAPQLLPAQNGDIELPLSFRFNFIESSSAGGNLVCRPLGFMEDLMSKQMKEAREAINAHPEWTDAEDLEAATKHGMRFGPNDKTAVLSLIPLKDLSIFYGPLRIKKARFSIAFSGMKQPGSSFADLHWNIDAEEVGTSRTLLITVEPFDGKIDGISE